MSFIDGIKGFFNSNFDKAVQANAMGAGTQEKIDNIIMQANVEAPKGEDVTADEINEALGESADMLSEAQQQTTTTAPTAAPTTAPKTNTKEPYTSTVILTGSSVEATKPSPWGQAFINLKQKDEYTLNDLMEAVYPNASENERKDLANRFLNENADALKDINMQGNIKESLNDKLSDLRYPKFNSLDYNKTSKDLTKEVEFDADENYTFKAGSYKSSPRDAIAQDILDHYGITDGDFSSAAGQAIMKAIIENPENAQLFSSSSVKDLSTFDGFMGALTESYMKNGELNLTTPNVVVSFLNNSEQEYTQEELRNLATENSNYTSSQLSPTTQMVALASDNTYMDILDCIEYSTDENGNTITLKQAIESASDEEKASMIALGESALLQLAQNNSSLKGIVDENGQLIKNADGTSILNNEVGEQNATVDLKPVNYMLRQGAAPQMVETPKATVAKDPVEEPSTEPSENPTVPEPTPEPTEEPPAPTEAPTTAPTPTEAPTEAPVPTEAPTAPPVPTEAPTTAPVPTEAPTCPPVPDVPVGDDVTPTPTAAPTIAPPPSTDNNKPSTDVNDSGADFKPTNPPCGDNVDTPVENPDKNLEPPAPEPDKGTTTPDSPCGPIPDTGVDNSDISLQSASVSSHSEPKATITSESLSGATVSEFHSSAVNSSSESHSSGSDNNSSGGGESHSSHEERKKEED